MKKQWIIWLLILPCLAMAQELPPDVFYKHFEGNINKNILVSANIIKVNDSIYGNYYQWYVEHEGESDPYHYSPTISLYGKMTSPNEFTIMEFGKEDAVFEGIFIDGNRMEGIWKSKKIQKDLPFELYEKYPKGSMAFKAFYLRKVQRLRNEENSPEATIDLTMLIPDNYPAMKVGENVKKAVYDFFYRPRDYSIKPNELFQQATEAFFSRYVEANQDLYDRGQSLNWIKIQNNNIKFNEDYILSIEWSSYAYTGGAHGLQVDKYLVMDLTNGNKLVLDDLFIPDYKKDLILILNDQFRKKYEISPDKPLTQAGFFVDTVFITKNYFLGKTGMTFHYNSYELAPHSMGHIEIFIPYKKLMGIIKKDGILSRITGIE